MANGMTLGEIIDEISEKVKITISETSIIRKINNIQQDIFRKYYRVPTVTKADLQSGFAIYDLPCSISSIIEVVVNGVEYDYQSLYGEGNTNFFYGINNKIGIFPTPKTNVSNGLLIFHYSVPTKLTTDDIDNYPDLDSDFHMLLVYGVISDIAEDAKISAQNIALYNDLLKDLISVSGELIPPTIRVE